ncbi:MAG: CDGSH iron-sulfur domain-containing protein [Gammaproteobacteria bacterium]|nr:CDGSH iron-sulfur domain-containing protein [Gammaproteobacteria bacterium]
MNSEKTTNLTLVPNGPCIVKNLKSLSNVKGAIDVGETTALCRCGASTNKPFCDGSHEKIKFLSDKSDDRLEDKKQTYIGNNITIYDNRSLCAHAGYCTDNLSAVFRMKQEPWVNADAATAEDIIETIKKCPSGALSYSVNVNESGANNTSTIMVAPNGPYVVSGRIELTNTTWGSGASKEQFTLCRCGASKNKPFCDGSHWEIKFTDDKN